MNESFSIAAIAALVKRRALYFALPFAALAAASVTAVMALPAIYESHATILVESQQIPTDLVKSTVTALASERLQNADQPPPPTLARRDLLDRL